MTQTLKDRQVSTMDRGEAAIEANLSADRARVKKAENLNERVSYHMDERLARLQADTMIKPPPR